MKIVTKLTLLFLSLWLLRPCPASACIEVLAGAQKAGLFESAEEHALNQIDLNVLHKHPWVELAIGVYKIEISPSQSVVLRIPGYLSDVSFERFASYFVRSVRGRAAPVTVNTDLPNLSRGKLVTQLIRSMEKHKERAEKVKSVIDYIKQDHSKISLTTFVEGTLGKQYKREVVSKHKPGDIFELYDSYPKEIRQQLADQWALHVVLGITDFHVKNWIVFKGQIIAIDLALKSSSFKKGKLLDLEEAFEPFDGFQPDPIMIREMIRDISPGVRGFIQTLNSRYIQTVAEASGMPITEIEIAGMLRRSQHLLSDQ